MSRLVNFKRRAKPLPPLKVKRIKNQIGNETPVDGCQSLIEIKSSKADFNSSLDSAEPDIKPCSSQIDNLNFNKIVTETKKEICVQRLESSKELSSLRSQGQIVSQIDDTTNKTESPVLRHNIFKNEKLSFSYSRKSNKSVKDKDNYDTKISLSSNSMCDFNSSRKKVDGSRNCDNKFLQKSELVEVTLTQNKKSGSQHTSVISENPGHNSMNTQVIKLKESIIPSPFHVGTSGKLSSNDNNANPILYRTGKKSKCSRKSNSLELNKAQKSKSKFRKTKQELAEWKSLVYNENGEINKEKLTLRDFIFFNPPNNPMNSCIDDFNKEAKEYNTSDDSYLSFSDYEENEIGVTPQIVPQLKVSSDGQIVVNQESLYVKQSRVDKKKKILMNSKVIQEGDTRPKKRLRRKNDDTMYSLLGIEQKQTMRKVWTPEETLKFYKVLNEYGSDFTVMMESFPYRTRKQLKRKFTQEEKVRLKYVDIAMMEPDSIDFVKLEEELNKKKIEKEKKQKDKERLLEEKKEKLRKVEQEYERIKNSQKGVKRFDFLGGPVMGTCRRGKKYDDKVKRMKSYISEMKLKYVEETGYKKGKPQKKNKEKEHNVFDDSGSDSDSYLFDIRLSFYEENFCPKQEDLFIQEIKNENDLNLFIGLSSDMFCHLGKKWKVWVKRTVVDQLLKYRGEDCPSKLAAKKLKAEIEEDERLEKLENSYRIFSDPYDYIEPWEVNRTD